MPKVIYIEAGGRETVANIEPGVSLMQAALHNGVAGIVAECGGGLACATCRIEVPEEWQARLPEAKQDEVDMLGLCEMLPPATRLSCQVLMTSDLDGLRVIVPEDQY